VILGVLGSRLAAIDSLAMELRVPFSGRFREVMIELNDV
jgi:hypothetical protein